MKFLNLICFLLLIQSMNAQTLLSKKVSECDETEDATLKINRIYSKEMVNDTLVIKMSYAGNCGADHSLKYEFRSDTLYLYQNARYGVSLERLVTGNDTVYKEVQVEAMCICYYFETLKFGSISDTSVAINWNGKVLPISKSMYVKLPDEYSIDPKSLKNQMNEVGQRVGLWEISYPHSRKIHHLIYYVSIDENSNYVQWSKSFDKKGNITSVGLGFGRELDYIEYQQLMQQSQQCWPDE